MLLEGLLSPVWAGAGLALLAAACGHAVAVRTSTATPAVHDRATAMALAVRLLDRVALPPGATVVARAPSAPLEHAPQAEVTPDLAQATHFAVVGTTPAATLAALAAHPPPGTASGESGSSGPVGDVDLGYDYRDLPAGVANAELLWTVAPGLRGGSDLRVDVQVSWLPPKPQGTAVPAADRVAVVSVTESQPRRRLPPWSPAPRRVVATGSAVVAGLRSAVDGLPAAFPGVTNCPADFGTRWVVAFATAAAAAPDITFTDGGCGGVAVTRPGQAPVELGRDDAFSAAVSAVLRLPASPSSPSTVGGALAAG